MRKYVSTNNVEIQSTYLGTAGELTIDPDTLSIKVHDGSTPGGFPIGGGGGPVDLGNLTVSDQTLTATQDRSMYIGGGNLGHGVIDLQPATSGGNIVVSTISANWVADYGNIPVNNVSDIFGSSAAIGPDGSVYTIGGDQSVPRGVIIKYNTFGTLVWQKTIDLASGVGESLVVDASGNIWCLFSNYVTSSVNVYKLDSTGAILNQWEVEATLQSSYGYDLIIDSQNNVLITGHTYEVNNVFADVVSAGSSGSAGVMLAAVSAFSPSIPTGDGFWKMTGTGITGTATITTVTTDGTNYTLTIDQSGVDFDAPGGAWTITHVRSSDVSILKLDTTANSLAWQWNFGNSVSDNGFSVTVDSADNVIVAGVIPDPLQPFFNNNLAIIKLDTSGTVIWKKVISEASALVSGQAVTVDTTNNIYVAGIRKTQGVGNVDQAIVIKLTALGAITWAKTLSAPNVICRAYGIAYNSADSLLYVTGIAHGIVIDVFVAVIDLNGNLEWQRLLKNTNSSVQQSYANGQKSIAVSGNHYVVTGYYYDNNANQFTARLSTGGAGIVSAIGPGDGNWLYDTGYLVFDTDSALIVSDLTTVPIASAFTVSVSTNSNANLSYTNSVTNLPDPDRGLVVPNLISSVINTHDVIGIDELTLGAAGNVILSPDSGNILLSGHIIPTATDTFNIGSPTQRIGTIYAASNTIYIGNVKLQDIGGTFTATTVYLDPETDEEVEVNTAGNKMGYLELTNNPLDPQYLIGNVVAFTHTAYGSEVDEIDTDMSITRGEQRGIYNSAVEPSYQNYTSPANTEWNADGWSDLRDVKTRTYTTWRDAVNSNPPQSVGNELVMHDITNNKYWAIKFTEWGENNGGSFAYTRQLIDTSFEFTKIDYGNNVDVITSNVHITRGDNQGIYNPVTESGWDSDISPEGTLWNADGWADLSNLTDRTYTNFYDAVNGNLGNNVPGKELIMYIPAAELYYTVKFNSWTSGDNGGGFSYTRLPINPEQVDQGIKFADGTVQTTAYNPTGSLDNWGTWDVVQYSGHAQVTYTAPTMTSVTCSPELDQTNTNRVQISQTAYPDALLFWNSGNNPKSITVDGNTYQYNGGYYNGSSFFLDINAYINYTTGSVVQLNYPSVSGSGPVKWWDAALSPKGSSYFRGAVIDYHAYSQDAGTIIGTIWIADDDSDDNITHSETNSGGGDLGHVDLWDRSGNENEIYFKRLDLTSDTVKIQWTSRVFYGAELYD